MSVRRVMAAVSAATVALSAAVLALLVIVAGPAAAAVGGSGDAAGPVAPSAESPVPVILARTGLDLTTPIVVGLSVLALGTALVAWAVLHGSRGARSGNRN